MEIISVKDMDELILGLILLFVSYYLYFEVVDWFKTINNLFSNKKELVIAIPNVPVGETIQWEEMQLNAFQKKELEKLEKLDELKEEVIEQVSTKYVKAPTPDLSNIKLPGLNDKAGTSFKIDSSL